jgi:uncharacterized membrane protein YidH (DUF202 family)
MSNVHQVNPDPELAGAGDRTDLAWIRSALTFGGIGVAILKGVEPIGHARPVDGIVAIVLGAAVLLISAGYVRRHDKGEDSHRSLLFVSAGTMAVGLVAIIVGAVT